MPRSCDVAALSAVKIETGADCVTFTTTDLDTFASFTVPATVHESGVALVSFKSLFADMPKGKGSGDITLKTSDDGLAIINGHTSTFPTVAAEDFPRSPYGAATGAFAAYPLDIAALAMVAAATAKETSRPILASVFLSGSDMVATDSYRLHLVSDLPVNFPSMLIPAYVVAQVVKAKHPAMLCVRDVDPDRFEVR